MIIKIVVYVCLLLVHSMPAMQKGVKAHKAQVHKAKQRMRCNDYWKIFVLPLALAAAVLSSVAECPQECYDASTRFTDDASQQLAARCAAIPQCPKPGFFSPNEINNFECGT